MKRKSDPQAAEKKALCLEVLNIAFISTFSAKGCDLVLHQCCFPAKADTLLLPSGHGNSKDFTTSSTLPPPGNKKNFILNENKSHCVPASLAKKNDYRCIFRVLSSFGWRQSFHMTPNTCLGLWLLFLPTSRKQINNFLWIHRPINNVY